jgi:hypothetical protein
VEGVQIEEASEDEELEPSDTDEPASAVPATAEPPSQPASRAGTSARSPETALSDVQADLQVSCDFAGMVCTHVSIFCNVFTQMHVLSSTPLRLMNQSLTAEHQNLTAEHWPLAQEFQDTEERREELKRQIAIACSQLLRDPEAHTRNLRALLALTVDKDTEVMQRGDMSRDT